MIRKKPLGQNKIGKAPVKQLTTAVRRNSKFIAVGGGVFAVLVAFASLIFTGPQPSQPPVASFSFSPTYSIFLLNEAIQFTDFSTDDGAIEDWLWDFGDGTTSTTKNPTHEYTEPGEYTVTLTVFDDQGQSGTASQVINVVGPSRVSIEYVDGKPRLLVNGEPFTVKGVAYSPTPVGESPALGYNWWMDPGTYTNDFPMLKEMGANTIRTYGSDATREALDNAYANGIYVIMGHWVNYWLDLSDESNRQSEIEKYLEFVRKWKNHPAVLMWCFGNEVEHKYEASGTGRDVTDWYTLLQEACAAIKAEDNMHLTIYSHIDSLGSGGIGDPSVKSDDDSLSALDVWGVNVYRGYSFGSFFDQYASVSSKPLVVTEFGCDAWSGKNGAEDQTTQASYVRNQWLEIEANLAPAGVALGGTVFEWSDEWWKPEGSNNSIHETTAHWQNPNYTDPNMNEQWWGITAISSGTYQKTPREAYYTLQELWTSASTPDFILSVSPVSGTVQPGGSVEATVMLRARGTYAHAVSLSYSGQPSGVTIDFSPGSGTPSFSSTMTINVGTTAAQGNYTIVITGIGADGKTHTCNYSLVISTVGAHPYVVYSDAGIPKGDIWTWSGGDWGLDPGEFDSEYTGESPPEGSKCYRTVSGSGAGNYAGWGVFLGTFQNHVCIEREPKDLTGYNNLKFWVKTPEDLKVEVEDNNGKKSTQYISSYGWDGANTWQEITIPRGVFTGVDITKIFGPFLVTVSGPDITFYIDNVRWVV